MRTAISILTMLLLLSGAASQEQRSAARQFEVDPDRSWIRVLVFRSGMLAGFGHNHTVTSRDLGGSVRWSDSLSEATVVLRFPVDELKVDDPGDRAAEGSQFEAPLSARDVEGTRRNMLGGRLLDAERFGEIVIESTRVSGELPTLTVEALATVKDASKRLRFEVNVNLVEDLLIATGISRLSHDDLGLRPFSAGFGTLRVADEMLIRFRIVARSAGD